MRSKKSKPNIFKPSTKEIFLCLSSAPNWLKLLLDQNNGRDYGPFLTSLIEKKFCEEERVNERLTMKMIASILNHKTSDVTKWLGKIYDDLFELNIESEAMFKTEGIKHNLYFKYLYDNTATFTMWLMQTPRKYETIYFPFVNAKIGTQQFWVKDVYHTVTDEGQEIDLHLSGGILNRYREFLYDRALFEEKIGFFERYDLSEHEIDRRLRDKY